MLGTISARSQLTMPVAVLITVEPSAGMRTEQNTSLRMITDATARTQTRDARLKEPVRTQHLEIFGVVVRCHLSVHMIIRTECIFN